MNPDTFHTPVLLNEVLEALALRADSVIVDATCGEGGHSAAIAERIPDGRLFCLDRDARILELARERLSGHPNASFHRIRFNALGSETIQGFPGKADGIIADLGISMYHLKSSGDSGGNLGFSYTDTESLDMRLDPDCEVSASDVVNRFSERDLADILYRYGEEYESRAVSRAIIRSRPVKNARDLADIVRRAKRPGRGGKAHPATKTFQALRIFVNKELEILASFIPRAVDNLNENGRLVVISYHSLEDRIVKNAFRDLQKDGRGTVLTKKPVVPTSEEVRQNRAARSAKLRVFQKQGR